MTHSSALVDVIDLFKHYQLGGGLLRGRKGPTVRAVDGVDLTVMEGETLGLVGESGCGKSTLGRLLMRLIEPTAGSILFGGEDLTTLRAAEMRYKRRQMQIIFQDPYGALNPRMSVEQLIMEPLIIHRIPGDHRAIVRTMINTVGLPANAAERYPHEFSGGQRQRIGIARALVLSPKFLVCDEAVSALDVSVQAQIINLLQDLQEEFRLTYLFIGHDLGVVRHISDRIAVMYLGKIVEVGPTVDLFANPQHPYTQALIAAAPVMHPSLRGLRKRTRLDGDIPSALNPPAGCRFHTRCPAVMDVCRTQLPLVSTVGSTKVSCHLVAQAISSRPRG